MILTFSFPENPTFPVAALISGRLSKICPAVLRMIAQVAAHAAKTGRKASLCGDAGAEPKFIAGFLRAGLRALSIAPTALGRVKGAVAKVDLSGVET